MLVDDLYEMKVKDLLEEFCLVYSPKCDSENYHFDYNHMAMLCNECGHVEEPKTEEY